MATADGKTLFLAAGDGRLVMLSASDDGGGLAVVDEFRSPTPITALALPSGE